MVSSFLRQDPAGFCRKMSTDFGIHVYRKSTGDSRPGKSSAKGPAASGNRTPAPVMRVATAAT